MSESKPSGALDFISSSPAKLLLASMAASALVTMAFLRSRGTGSGAAATSAGGKKERYKVTVTGDCIVLKKIDGKDHILLITRGKPGAFQGFKAFPGGHLDPDEDPKVCALRELEEECSIKGRDAQLICVRGEKGRDPRGHVVTCAYFV